MLREGGQRGLNAEADRKRHDKSSQFDAPSLHTTFLIDATARQNSGEEDLGGAGLFYTASEVRLNGGREGGREGGAAVFVIGSLLLTCTHTLSYPGGAKEGAETGTRVYHRHSGPRRRVLGVREDVRREGGQEGGREGGKEGELHALYDSALMPFFI